MFSGQTLGVVFIFASILYFFISFSLYKLLPNEKSLKYFSLHSSFWIIGMVLIVLREIIHDFFSIVLANSMFILGAIFLIRGVKIYFNKINNFKYVELVLLPFSLIYLSYFTFIEPSYTMRTNLLSIVLITIFILSGNMFITSGDKNGYLLNKITSIVFFTGATLFFFRIITMEDTSNPLDALYSTKFIMVIPYFVGITLNIWLSSFLALMCITKLNNQLKILNNDLRSRVDEEVKQKLEQQKLIMRQQKLATMGDMISTIAHQWRQPLNSIHLIAQRLKYISTIKEVNKDEISEISTDILRLTQHMKKSVENFRSYLNPNIANENFTIEEFLTTISDIVETILKNNNINIVYEYNSESLKDIVIDGKINEFCEAILNVIINSKDAFIENDIKDPEIRMIIEIQNDSIIIVIKDNAGGIDNKIINKISTPFFTTKSNKQGTGIGLYITKTIVQDRFGGNILFWNESDGLSFKISIPYRSNRD